MYTDFYGLRELPFNLTPDPKFLYFSASHQEALAQMAFGVNMKRGFVVITGEVGTGKTTLIHALLEQLDVNTQTAYLYHAILGAKGLFQFICREFGISFTGRETKNQLIVKLSNYLISTYNSGGNAVLIIDEAQNLKPHILEEIRLISNSETIHSKLIQILLVGQPEFGKILDRKEIRQLKQRVALRYHLSRLSRGETEEYINHRLKVAGYIFSDPIFSPGAVDEIYAYTHGTPRAINILCENALIMGYSVEARHITPEIINKVQFEDVFQEMELAKPVTNEIEIKTIQSESVAVRKPGPETVNLSIDKFNTNGQTNASLLKRVMKKLLLFRNKKLVH
ncbi:MAG: AAA family ATPase [bacterium]|nr:MAG: AAA family ATPase [bacterium]